MHMVCGISSSHVRGGLLTNIKPQVHTFVNRKPRHQSMLVVHMGTQGTNPVG